MESTYLSWSPPGVHLESIRSPSGVYLESIRSLPGVHQEYQDFIRTPDGVHQDAWGSVTYRNGGGLGESNGMLAKGSPTIFRTIRNLSGRSAITGRILWATGLYFRFPKVDTCGPWVSVVEIGTKRVRGEIDVLVGNK